MPASRRKDRDFSQCTFRSRVPGLPAGIQHMLERAFDSLGTDVDVLKRWNRPVALPGGGSILEMDYFPCVARRDICCADGVAFVLYHSGVVDLGRDREYFRARKMNGASMSKAIHWAHYYAAHEGNEDRVYELPKIDTSTPISQIDMRDWLPGDIFLYFNETGDPEADHVNIYLGPFVEVVDGEEIPEPVYHMYNSSKGTTGGNAFCTAAPFAHHLEYCRRVGRSIVRVRVKAIERLFRNQISAPIVLDDAAVASRDTAGAEIAWRLAEASAAPYPVGRNLTWHEGVHLIAGEGVKSQAVESFAPGEIVLARFGKPTRGGDSSFVLARHRFVPGEGRLLGAPPPEGVDDDPAASSSKPLYSLYMQLAPLSTYLDDAHPIEPGLPALHDGQAGAPLPADRAVAPPWLQKLWPQRVPDLVDIVPDSAPLTILALSRSGPDASPRFVPLGQVRGLVARTSHPLPELASVEVDGTTYWLLPIPGGRTNAGVWDMKVPPATVPRARKLAYYNPQSGTTFDTPVLVGASTVLRHEADGELARLARVLDDSGNPVTGPHGTLVQIDAHATPGIDMTVYVDDAAGGRDHYDYEESTKTLIFHDDVKRIVVYTRTTGDGDRRDFDASHRFDLAKIDTERALRVMARANTGRRTKRPRAWLDLRPGVWMTDAEIDRAEQLLADRDTTLREGIKARLAAGRSCLVAVETTPHSGWEMRDGHVAASSVPPESGFCTLHRSLTGQGSRRGFARLPKDLDADQDQSIVLDIPPPPEDVSIYPLLSPSRRARNAVIEIVFAATQTGTNRADIEAVRRANEPRTPVAKKLMSGALVDLRREAGVDASVRSLARERIGQMGGVAGPPDGASFVPGVHFELFSGENLVDAAVAGSDGTLVPVPRSPWLVHEDAASDGFFSSAFVQRFVELLRKEGPGHRIDLKALDTAFGNDGVVQPREWIDFCAKNHRALSRIISVHAPEWTIDWAAQIGGGTRGTHLGAADREALKADTAETRWWTDDVTLEGITGRKVFFYHPLRFIEWLRTGIDFVLPERGNAQPRIEVQPVEGGPAVELAPDAKDAGLFRFRTFVGESGAKTESRFRVRLHGVDTATPSFTVVVNRGVLRTVRLTRPSVSSSIEQLHGSIGADFHVPVRLGSTPSGYLLADGNAHLRESGYGETTAAFRVSYNVRIPDRVVLRLEGDADFVFGAHEVAGAQAKPSATPREITLALQGDGKVAGAVEDSVVEGARMYTVRVNVTASTTRIDRSAKLVATFSGGDLAAERRLEVPVTTRVVTRGARGEDVAKLQLYLSQIHAEDDLPCYRVVNKAENTDPGKLRPVTIDGGYGLGLARALWRFIYRFAPLPGWRLRTLAVGKAKGEDTQMVDLTRLHAVSASLRDGPTPRKVPDGATEADALFARRVGAFDRKYDHWPVVGPELIAEIVERFAPPFVLPHIDVFFEETEVRAPPGAKAEPDWNLPGRIGKSTVLPIAGDLCVVRISWSAADVERHGDMPIVLEIPEASAYRFLDPGFATKIERPLRKLLRDRTIGLFSSQKLSTRPADNVLVVRTQDGRKIGERQLHGSRDLLRPQAGDGCRDAALVQSWLAKIPHPTTPDTMLYDNVRTFGRGKDRITAMAIDGKWNGKCAAALKRFQQHYAPTATDFPALALALRTMATR